MAEPSQAQSEVIERSPGPPPIENHCLFTPVQQAWFLKGVQPNSHVKLLRGDLLIWEGALQPTPLSDVYTVRIKLRDGYLPQTWVVSPPLRPREDAPIPHMYRQQELCLFRQRKDQWSGAMKLTETILPWASLWLFFYETWLVTGEWLGGGEHPETSKPPPPEKLSSGTGEHP